MTADPNISYRLLQRALETRGFSSRLDHIDGHEYIEFTAPNGRTWLTSTSLVTYPFNNQSAVEIADNKSLGYAWVGQFGVRWPATKVLGPHHEIDEKGCAEWLRTYQRLVVKPEGSFGGHGVTLDIRDFDSMQRAVQVARQTEQLYDEILIQQQVEGDEFRFVVLGGEVVSVLWRQSARVEGDGTQTLAELIEEETKARHEINCHSMVRYPDVAEIIEDSLLLTSSRVPAAGEIVHMAKSTMIAGGASVYDVKNAIHDSYIALAKNLVGRLGAGFLVVDLLLENFQAPMTRHNTYFNEFNKAPALKMFYACRDGKNYDMVGALCDAIERELEN